MKPTKIKLHENYYQEVYIFAIYKDTIIRLLNMSCFIYRKLLQEIFDTRSI